MSRAAALVWTLIALILGLVVWFTQPRTQVQSTAPEFLPDFSPAQITQLELTWPGGQSVRLSRVDARWIFQAGSSQGSTAWPAEPSRIQGLLRLLQEARAADGAGAMPTAIFLTLARETGAPLRLAVDPLSLGGRTSIARLGPDGRVEAVASMDEQFGRALDPLAIESWRSKDLLFWPPEATSAFASNTASATVELAKLSGAWMMNEPLRTKADAAAVEGALLLLSKSSVERFLPASDDQNWNEPVRILRFASRSNAPGARRDIEQTIEVGSALDAGTRLVRISARDAEAQATLFGPEVAIVSNSLLEAIPAVPDLFISKFCLDLPSADVSSIEFGSSDQNAAFRRSATGTFGPADAAIRDLLKLLAETPASQVKLIEKPADPAPGMLRVRVVGPNAAPLGEFHLKPSSVASKVSGAPAVPAIEVTSRNIVRSIPWQRPTDFLASLRSLEAAPAAP
ncbi:MAG: hypothetical protein J0L78_09865 [Planctomycetes bacterium]|nr:hypothetical protein [Planctomycetota bacterium]